MRIKVWLLIAFILIIIAICIWWYTPSKNSYTYANSVASKWKTAEDAFQGLYHTHPFVKMSAVEYLIAHPSEHSIQPMLKFIREKVRWINDVDINPSSFSDILISIGPPAIPFILEELKQTHDAPVLEVLSRALSGITCLPYSSHGIYSSAEAENALISYWLNWWEQNKNKAPAYWKKEAIAKYHALLEGQSLTAIDGLWSLTKQPFGAVIVQTQPEDMPSITEPKKWEEWINKYGEIDKWKKWIGENYDYIYWDKNMKYFVVNEEAKAKGISVNPETGQMIPKDNNKSNDK